MPLVYSIASSTDSFVDVKYMPRSDRMMCDSEVAESSASKLAAPTAATVLVGPTRST